MLQNISISISNKCYCPELSIQQRMQKKKISLSNIQITLKTEVMATEYLALPLQESITF